jgi:hypothetical protein
VNIESPYDCGPFGTQASGSAIDHQAVQHFKSNPATSRLARYVLQALMQRLDSYTQFNTLQAKHVSVPRSREPMPHPSGAWSR